MLRASADGRFVAQLASTDNPDGCGDLERLRATDDRGCAAFSVYEIASGRRVLGPVVPPFGPGDIAINADGSLVAVAGGFDGDVAVYRTAGERRLACGARRDRGSATVVQDTAAVSVRPGRAAVRRLARRARSASSIRRRSRSGARLPGLRMSSREPRRRGRLARARRGRDRRAGRVRPAHRRPALDGRPARRHPRPVPEAGRRGDDRPALLRRPVRRHLRALPRARASAPASIAARSSAGSATCRSPRTDASSSRSAARPAAVSRWRLDGSGPVTDLVAAGQLAADGYNADGRSLVVARRPPKATIRRPSSPSPRSGTRRPTALSELRARPGRRLGRAATCCRALRRLGTRRLLRRGDRARDRRGTARRRTRSGSCPRRAAPATTR